MKKVKKRVKKKAIILVLIPLILIIAIIVVNVKNMLAKPLTVKVVSNIDEYNYYLENTDSRIYKKYYKELEKELEDQKVDEENYVSLLAKLFTIDFYTLSNKMTNQDIGGIQFVHESQKESFKNEATNNIYKYVKSNLTGKRKQELPEVKNATVEEVKQLSYENEDANLEDSSAYQTKVKLEYVKDLEYPTNPFIQIWDGAQQGTVVDAVAFENNYSATDAKATIQGMKVLNSTNSDRILADDDFTFIVEALGYNTDGGEQFNQVPAGDPERAVDRLLRPYPLALDFFPVADSESRLAIPFFQIPYAVSRL